MRVPFAGGLEVFGVEVVVITDALTGIAADEKNIADMVVLSGQRHFIECLQFLLREVNFDSFVAVFNLFLYDERSRSLVIVYAVNEGGVDKSLQVCLVLVDYFCHITVLLQIIDIARHKCTVNICPPEFVQWIKTFRDTDKAFSMSYRCWERSHHYLF